MNQNKIKIIAVLLLLCISAAWLERYEIQESGQNLPGQMADKNETKYRRATKSIRPNRQSLWMLTVGVFIWEKKRKP